MSHHRIVVTLLAFVVVCLFAGCESPPEPPTTATQQLPLTPERAKAALLEMMRTKPGSDLDWFKGDVPDEMAKMKIEVREDGWCDWTGAYSFHLSKAVYSFVVMPKPGARACAFEYTGTFSIQDGRWVASPPILVRTAMQAGNQH
jgi:hypothetical protein